MAKSQVTGPELLQVLKVIRDFESRPRADVLARMPTSESPLLELFHVNGQLIVQITGPFRDTREAVRLVMDRTAFARAVDRAQRLGLVQPDDLIRNSLSCDSLNAWRERLPPNGQSIPPLLTQKGKEHLQEFEDRVRGIGTQEQSRKVAEAHARREEIEAAGRLREKAQRQRILQNLRSGEDRVVSNVAIGKLHHAIVTEFKNSPTLPEAFKAVGVVRTLIDRWRKSCDAKLNNAWDRRLATQHDADGAVKLMHAAQIVWGERVQQTLNDVVQGGANSWPQIRLILERLTGVRGQFELLRFWASLNLMNELPRSDHEFVFDGDYQKRVPPIKLYEAGILRALAERSLPKMTKDQSEPEWRSLDPRSVRLVTEDASNAVKGIVLESPPSSDAIAIENLWKRWCHVRMAHWRLQHPDRDGNDI